MSADVPSLFEGLPPRQHPSQAPSSSPLVVSHERDAVLGHHQLRVHAQEGLDHDQGRRHVRRLRPELQNYGN